VLGLNVYIYSIPHTPPHSLTRVDVPYKQSPGEEHHGQCVGHREALELVQHGLHELIQQLLEIQIPILYTQRHADTDIEMWD